MKLSEADRDLVTRTVLAEAGTDASPIERAAVAHTILNRVGKYDYPGDVRGVLFQRNAFEPWGLPRKAANHPLRFDANSDAYKATAEIVNGAAAGSIADPTSGATHFLAPDEVSRRVKQGKMAWPDWAPGGPTGGLRIGATSFWPEPGGVAADDAAALQELTARRAKAATTAQDSQDDAAAIKELNARRAVMTESATPAPTAAPAAPTSAPAPDISVPKVPTADDPRAWQAPEQRAAELARGQGSGLSTNPAVQGLRDIRAAVQPQSVFGKAESIWDSFLEEGASGLEQIGRGPGEILNNRTASGVGDIGLGALRTIFSPATATLQELVTKPVTEATGNPEIGARAGLLAGLSVPLPKVGSVAKLPETINATRGTVRGVQDLITSIHDEDLPHVIGAMERGQAIGDASQAARQQLQGVAVTKGPWQDYLDRVSRQRGRDAYHDVIGATNELRGQGVSDSAYNTLQAIIQRARDTGAKVIDPIVEKAGPADITPVLNVIDKEFGSDPVARAALKKIKNGEDTAYPLSPYQRELLRVRDRLVGSTPERERKFLDVKGEQGLHEIQSDLRVRAQNLRDRNDAAGLFGVRETIKDAIDKVAPGYRKGIEEYRSDKEVREAFGKGLGVNTTQGGEAGILEDSPEAWRDWEKHASKDEADAARAGSLANLQQRIARANKPVTEEEAAAPIPRIDALERARYDVLFGKAKTDGFIQQLKDARNSASLNRILFGGSQTAQRTMAAEGAKVREVTGKPPSGASIWGPVTTGFLAAPFAMAHGLPGELGPMLGMAAAGARGIPQGIRYGAQRYGQAQDIVRNETLARHAVAPGGTPEHERLLNLLKARREAVSSPKELRDLVTSPFRAAFPL